MNRDLKYWLGPFAIVAAAAVAIVLLTRINGMGAVTAIASVLPIVILFVDSDA